MVSSSSARPLKFNENVVPCHGQRLGDNSGEEVEKIPVRLAGKYGASTILSMLPKGQSASSGPSRGTNDVKN
ncbi:hypothetical protein M5689_002321 [Euphorbia peplus]|nr:hypothetical protein M5689_002321 [Euphorbia peplus]